MPNEDLVKDLSRNMDAAIKRLASVSGKSAQGAENQYGQAYQDLVRIGAKPQIRLKYRSQG